MDKVITTTDYDAVERPVKVRDVSSSPASDGFISALKAVENYLGFELTLSRVVARYVVTDENRSWPLKVPQKPLTIVYSLVDQNGDAVTSFEPVLTKVFPPMPKPPSDPITWGAAITALTLTYEEMLEPPIALAIAKVAADIFPVSYTDKDIEMSKDLVQAAGGVEKLVRPEEYRVGISNEARHLLSPYRRLIF